jgi:phosphoadenosine phosphosulfate reductase
VELTNSHASTLRPTEEALKALSDSFEAKQPWDLLEYALKAYPRQIVLACSFGAEDVALVDMMHRIDPDAPLFYLDTDFLFPETIDVRDRIIAHYGLKPAQVIQMKSKLTPDQQAVQHGPALWASKPDQSCELRKIEPLSRILANYRAWITGIRRDQAPTRANAGLIEWDKKFNLIKVNPMARWSSEDVWTYLQLHEVPYNALHDRNYPSIGCTHCTAPVLPGNDPRSGRWKNFGKTECGLHK